MPYLTANYRYPRPSRFHGVLENIVVVLTSSVAIFFLLVTLGWIASF